MSVRLTRDLHMSHIEMIIRQSPWLAEVDKIEEDVHLNRLHAFPLIYRDEGFLNHPFKDGVYIATGPRQIGKSTHLKLFIKQHINAENHQNFLYFNCDLLDTKQDIVAVVEDYLTKFPSKKRRFVLLDEVTAVKDSFLAIKFLVDSGRDKNITYVLTGSNTISIKKTGEYLPGRRGKGIDFIFNPLSFKAYIELLHPDVPINLSLTTPEKTFITLSTELDLKKKLEIYLMTGGFPRVINEFHMNSTINEDVFMIYRSWLTSEIAKSDKKEFIAKSILERCLTSLGSDTSYNAFAQDTGIGSHNTVYDYLNFFESAYVLSVIYNFDIHQKKVNYKKNKKIYFNDPFIYAVIDAWLLGKPRQDYSYLKNPIIKSQLIENLVFTKLLESYKDVYFNRDNYEIDFILKHYFIEVKYQNKIVPDDYAYLIKQKQHKILVTKDTYQNLKDILLIPVEYFLLLGN